MVAAVSDAWWQYAEVEGGRGRARDDGRGRGGAADVWERLNLGRQRAILDALIVVTVLPQRPGRMPDGSRFDPHSIDIQPRRP